MRRITHCSSATATPTVRYVIIDGGAYGGNETLKIRHTSKCSLRLGPVRIGASSPRQMKLHHRYSVVPITGRSP